MQGRIAARTAAFPPETSRRTGDRFLRRTEHDREISCDKRPALPENSPAAPLPNARHEAGERCPGSERTGERERRRHAPEDRFRRIARRAPKNSCEFHGRAGVIEKHDGTKARTDRLASRTTTDRTSPRPRRQVPAYFFRRTSRLRTVRPPVPKTDREAPHPLRIPTVFVSS